MILWRPVGLKEMRLVFESGMRAFPPRLEGQPIFYPVLNAEYAAQIAGEWNTRETPFAGYVLRFEIPDAYAAAFDVHVVGTSLHRELWVPAEHLEELNGRIQGSITAERAFFGAGFRGDIPARFLLGGKDAYEQIAILISVLGYAPFDFTMEISTNAPTIFMNYPFWRTAGAHRLGTGAEALATCLDRMRAVWALSSRPAALVEDAILRD